MRDRVDLMCERVGEKNFNGIQIYCIDFSYLRDDELLEVVQHTCLEIQKIKSKTLFFIDVSETKLNMKSFNYVISVAKDMMSCVDKSAVIGVNGVVGHFFHLYKAFTGSSMRSFSTKEEAEAYLLS